jgi:hypothetical protein
MKLRYATLPIPFRLIATHPWFVVWDADGCHRWEVWQEKNAGGWSIGHMHRDRDRPDAGVGGGSMRVAAEWTGAEAAAIEAVLKNVTDYPQCERYCPWPGPNRNTFAQWVLARAGIRHRLGWRAFGKRYPAG